MQTLVGVLGLRKRSALAGALDQVQQPLSISIDGAPSRAEISPVLCFA